MSKLCCNQLACLNEKSKELDEQLQIAINNSKIMALSLEKKIKRCKKEIRKMKREKDK